MRGSKPVLAADFDSGEGSVENLDNFRKQSPLLRADLLSDWIDELQNEYETAINEMGNT